MTAKPNTNPNKTDEEALAFEAEAIFQRERITRMSDPAQCDHLLRGRKHMPDGSIESACICGIEKRILHGRR